MSLFPSFYVCTNNLGLFRDLDKCRAMLMSSVKIWFPKLTLRSTASKLQLFLHLIDRADVVICNKFTHQPLVCCWSYRPRCGVADATCCKPVTLMVWYVSSSRSSRNIRRGQVTKQCISCAIRGALVPKPDANVAGRGHARLGVPATPRRVATCPSLSAE